MSFRALTVFLTFLPLSQLFAQVAPKAAELGYPFITNYSPRDYEAETSNWAVLQNREGIIYVANGYGVLEFDGAGWRLIELPGRGITRSLTMDDKGTVYVGGSGQIGYLAPDARGETQFVSLLEHLPEELRDFADVWEAHAAPEGIYFTPDNHIFLWDGQTFKHWEPENTFHIGAWANGHYYVRQWQVGLMTLDGDSLKLVPGGEQFALERIYSILPYDEDRILIGTRTQGFFLYNGSEFRPFRTEADSYILENQLYLPGAVLNDGTFAFGTLTGGLVRMDRDGRLVQILNTSVGLSDNSVYYIYLDRAGDLWLALSVGISHVETSTPYRLIDERSGLVRLPNLVRRHQERLYVATNDGVSFFDERTMSFPEVHGITEQVFGLAEVAGDLLAGGTQTGVYRIDGDRATLLVGSPDRTYSVNALYPSSSDSTVVYVSLTSTVIAMKRGGDGTWREVGQSQFVASRIGPLAEEAPGVLWVGLSIGVARISFPVENAVPRIQDARVDTYGPDHGLPETGGIPYRIAGRMVAMVRGEAYRFDSAADKFVRAKDLEVVSTDGGYNDFFLEDRSGRMWISMGREVAVGTTQTDGSISWNSAPFLRLAGSQTGFVYPEADGKVWIATLDGLLKYDPKLSSNTDYAPTVLIRGVVVGSDSLLFGGSAPSDTSTKLPYSLNAVEFRYAMPSFAEAGKNRFQSMLEGFDDDWSAWSHEHRRSYTNLPPGEYRFRVRARNVTDVQSEEATFSFSILPPWYRTWWAYLLYALAIGGGLFGFIRMRTGHLEARHRELEQAVEDATSEIKQRVEELAVINGVQQGLVAEMDMQGIYDLVGDRIRDLFDAQAVVIRTFDRDQELEVIQYAIERGERLDIPPRPFDALSTYMMEHHEPLFFNENYAQEMKALGLRTSTKGDAPKSAVFQPLIVGDQIKGNISIQNVDREHAFSDSDVRLLATLANSMSVALENARLFDQTTRLLAESDQRAAELSTVNEISRALVSQLEFDALVQLVGDKIRETFKADMAYVAFLDEDEGMINFPYGYGDDFPPLQFGEGFTSQILRTGEPLLVNEDVSGTFENLGIQEIGKATASYLGVPVTVGRRVVGVMSAQSSTVEGRFKDDDLRLMSTIAANVGVALQNAESYRELNATLQNLKATQEQLVTQEKMASLGQLTAGIAHEIKNPLNFVNNFSELNQELAQDLTEEINTNRHRTINEVYDSLTDLVTSLKTNAAQISKHGKRADSIVRNMMQHASDRSTERFRVEVNAFVDEYIGLSYHGMKAQSPDLEVEIERDFDERAGNAEMAPQELGRVLLNLLNNALYAVHEKSRSTNGEYRPTVRLRTKRSAGHLEIRVEDNGPGIPDHVKEHIFEPLFTTKPAGSGTGLGLSLAFDIVTQVHGGSLTCETEVGRGTAFVVRLPVD